MRGDGVPLAIDPEGNVVHPATTPRLSNHYRCPNRLPPGAQVDSLSLSLEICSEAPMHHLDWPSDITLGINGVELGTWTSPSDFGGVRGRLTPLWQWESDSQ